MSFWHPLPGYEGILSEEQWKEKGMWKNLVSLETSGSSVLLAVLLPKEKLQNWAIH